MASEPILNQADQELASGSTRDLEDMKESSRSKVGGARINTESLLSISTKDSSQSPFTFWINPSQLSVQKPRIEVYRLTKAGFERYFFANDIWTLSYSGSTGVFIPTEPGRDPTEKASFDIRKTKAWEKFEEFDRFYHSREEEDLILHAEETSVGRLILEGSLNPFSFRQDSGDPFHIKYEFTFKGFPQIALQGIADAGIPVPDIDNTVAGNSGQVYT